MSAINGDNNNIKDNEEDDDDEEFTIKTRVEVDEEVTTDGRTSIKPIVLTKKQVSNGTNIIKLNKPILVSGFLGPGLVGSISTNYLIEQLQLHQIAYIDSDYILPGVIYVGKKLRHPFRLYANSMGSICIVVCDVPIMMAGVHSVINTIIKWARKKEVREVIVLEGIGVEAAVAAAAPPPPVTDILADSKRKALILSSNRRTDDDGAFLKHMNNNSNNALSVDTIFVAGISGGILASCLSSRISCKGLFIQTPSSIPDPEGAAILLQTLNTISKDLINVDVQQLKKVGQD
jgi:uncharacterized protein